ncbi:DUF3307 domain-containing protein [Salipiger mucosus]|uniref:DUF3307 domain-containing protein n=1 Tax=Salipiger mucosus DSM 16094 TaxID=1123237 RepID=S9Q682_9RHOB|nr:DUF3307 domain-containing protein [Salipiger mucosus]EPX75532.1 hypothetical protein Salmuc_04722 [Salipiger mucosus DSM 16094]
MIQTFAALLLAHVVADFVLQTGRMVRAKERPGVMALHIAVVGLVSWAALGGHWQPAVAATGAHLVIDAVKTWLLPSTAGRSLAAFLADQGAHLASLVAVAVWWPGAEAAGLWGPWMELLTVPALAAAGAVTAVLAGGHAVGLLMRRYQDVDLPEGLPNAGRVIGQLERALILLMVLTDQPAAIGFLIAAKSILRFDTAAREQKAGEYVIIGTLASFAWALAVAYATQALIELAAGMPTP